MLKHACLKITAGRQDDFWAPNNMRFLHSGFYLKVIVLHLNSQTEWSWTKNLIFYSLLGECQWHSDWGKKNLSDFTDGRELRSKLKYWCVISKQSRVCISTLINWLFKVSSCKSCVSEVTNNFNSNFIHFSSYLACGH